MWPTLGPAYGPIRQEEPAIRTACIILIAAMVAAGCGNRETKAPSEGGKDIPIPPELTKASTGPVSVERRGDDQSLQWTVRAESSNLELNSPNKLAGNLNKVTGCLYQKGVIASKFSADLANADQAKNKLDLSGQVVLNAEKEGLKMTALKLKWVPERKLIEASGHVMLESSDYIVGPFESILATPDLKKFGTPDTFGNPKPQSK